MCVTEAGRVCMCAILLYGRVSLPQAMVAAVSCGVCGCVKAASSSLQHTWDQGRGGEFEHYGLCKCS